MQSEPGYAPRVTSSSLRHVVNILLPAQRLASQFDLAKTLGHCSPRMTLERYARVVPGAQHQIAVVARGFFGVQLAADGATRLEGSDSIGFKKWRKPCRHRVFKVVEVCGFEPQTPYMRSKCSTN